MPRTRAASCGPSTALIRRARDESGAVTILMAICMTVVLGMAALVIDIGAAQARKAQLQDAADAAAMGLAQRCFESALTMLAACDGGVTGNATAIASGYAVENVNDASAAVTSVVFTSNTVKVTLTSDQPSFFARIFDITATDRQHRRDGEVGSAGHAAAARVPPVRAAGPVVVGGAVPALRPARPQPQRAADWSPVSSTCSGPAG